MNTLYKCYKKISVTSVSENVTGTASTTVFFLPTYRMKGNGKFLIEVSENKDVIPPPPQYNSRTPEMCGPWTLG
jgi:hypothetical protein